MEMLKTENLHYDYIRYAEEGEEPKVTHAVRGVDLQVEEGQFIAVIGHNGCGKSTLARHIDALLTPTEGTVWVQQMDTNDPEHLWDIRQRAGMVFQNPDNQIIASVVEEDVAFGPENLGVPTPDIWKRVEEALRITGMSAFRMTSPNRLSGGQKQRVAIAGVMAMQPKCIVLDEPTAMLDPLGRKEVLQAMHELNKEQHITVILITHYMEEITDADRVFVMDDGKIAMSGTPEEVFFRIEELQALGLDVPQVTDLAHELKKAGLPLKEPVLTVPELVEALCLENQKGALAGNAVCALNQSAEDAGPAAGQEEAVLQLEHMSSVYGQGTAYEAKAVDDVSLSIGQGEFIGIIGHTGSGKSTMIQHFNGLIAPTSGRVLFHGEDIWQSGYDRRKLRFSVGLVFQYPEYQLFETTILRDVSYGPKNQGLSEEECREKAVKALEQTGIAPELYEKSPLEVSGGQKRRVAIAGVLAMDPKILILDEPTAGLDPRGKKEILTMLAKLRAERGITVILVSHSMEDVARYVDRLIVMNKGCKAFDGEVKEVFRHYRELEEIGLSAPQVSYVLHGLKEKGWKVEAAAVTVEEAKEEILAAMAGKGNDGKGEVGTLC